MKSLHVLLKKIAEEKLDVSVGKLNLQSKQALLKDVTAFDDALAFSEEDKDQSGRGELQVKIEIARYNYCYLNI